MKDIVRIDDEVITADAFLKTLKLTGRFEELIEEMVRDKLKVHAAKRQGISLTTDEIQERADQFRRVYGLHRAKDMNQFLDAIGVSLDDFENFIIEILYQEKIMAKVCSDDAIEEYFRMHSPKFESIELGHIVLDSEGKAKEIFSLLEEEPELFPELAKEHSIADTRDHHGMVGKVLRGSLQTDIESKVFNAPVGEPLGPFASSDGSFFEIFQVTARHEAKLDEETKSEVRRLVVDDWLSTQAQEHRIEAL